MGLGYALTEELPCEDGVLATKLRDSACCVHATCRDRGDPRRGARAGRPVRRKGVGEIGLVPTVAAVAGVLEAFDGIDDYPPDEDSLAAWAMSVGRIRRPRDWR